MPSTLEQRSEAYARGEMDRLQGVLATAHQPMSQLLTPVQRVAVEQCIASAFRIGHGAGVIEKEQQPWMTK